VVLVDRLCGLTRADYLLESGREIGSHDSRHTNLFNIAERRIRKVSRAERRKRKGGRVVVYHVGGDERLKISYLASIPIL